MMTSVLVVVFVAVLVWYVHLYLGGHRAPAGQQALGDLDAASLAALKDDFNRSADRSRVILLLSPT